LAVLQFAIALGAIAGGIALDLYGVSVPLYMTAICGILAAALIATERSPAGALGRGRLVSECWDIRQVAQDRIQFGTLETRHRGLQ
jgi:hypothetical protein